MNSIFGHLTPRALTLACLSLLATPSGASGELPKADNAETAPVIPLIDTVVVTNPVLPTPYVDQDVSAVVIDRSELTRSAMNNPQDVAQFVPSLSIASHPPFSQMSMRGIGTSFDKGFELSTGIYVDEVYLGTPGFLDAALMDVARVEVLRGPQETSFGKGSSAGAFLISTIDPGDDWQLDGLLARGSDHDQTYMVAANIPFSTGAAVRLALLTRRYDGDVFNTTRNEQEHGVASDNGRVKARMSFENGLTSMVSWTRTRQRFTSGDAQLRAVGPVQLLLMRGNDRDVETDLTDERSSQDHASTAAQDGDRFDLRLEFHALGQRWKVIGSSLRFSEKSENDLDFSPIPLLVWKSDDVYSNNSLNLSVGASQLFRRMDYLAGVYVAESKNSSLATIDINAPSPSELGDVDLSRFDGARPAFETLTFDGQQRAREFAIYSQGSVGISDRLAVAAGIRYMSEQKGVHQIVDASTVGTPIPGPIATQLFHAREYDELRSKSFSTFCPKASVEYRTGETSVLFGSFAIAYKSGGYSSNAVSVDQLEARPERSHNYAAGWRTESKSLTLSATAFAARVHDLQQKIFVGSTFYIVNAAEATVEGLELDGAYRHNAGLATELDLALLRSRYQSFADGPCIAARAGTCDQSGRSLPEAPAYKSRLSVSYEAGVFDRCKAAIGMDWLLAGERDHQADHDPLDAGAAYSLLNMRFKLADAADRWTIQVLVSNLTNSNVTVASFDVPGLTGAHFASVLPNRKLLSTITFSL